MAVASNLTDISLCESLTNWATSGGPTMGLKSIAADDIYPVEGTYCIGGDCDIETGIYLYDYYSANGNTALNATTEHIYVWAMCITASFLDSKTNGGLRIVMEDGSGNQGYWYVGGNDTYFGGWQRFIIDGNSAPTSNNGTDPTLTNIYKVGFSFKATVKSKLPENIFIDLLQYGSTTSSALTVTGGTSGTPLTWEDVLTGDEGLAKPTGTIRKFGRVYFLQGPITFGDTGTGDTYFNDSNQIVVWEDTLASISYYNILLTGNATGYTSFVLGSVTGAGDSRFGYGGGVITAAGAHKWTIDAETNTLNVDVLNLYGVTLINSGDLQFDDNTDTQLIISCTFDACAQVQPNEALVLNSFFLNNTDSQGSIEMLDNDDDNIRLCTFKNTTNAIYFPSGQTATRDFVGLDIDATYDIYNDSGSSVTINADTNTVVDETENPAGSAVSVVNTKTLTIRNLVVGSRYTVEKVSDKSVVWTATTSTSSTETKTDYNYLGDVDVYIKVRYASSTTKYKPLKQQATITSNGMDVTVVQIEDTIA